MTRRQPPSLQDPLTLPAGPCWELEERAVDSTTFLRALPSAFPEATDAYFEGSSIDADIVKIFEHHANVGPYLPEPQTIWTTGTIKRFRCRFTPSLCEALAAASEHHAEPELFDHIFLYADRQVLLEWPDAFANYMWVASLVSEPRVRAFAVELGLSYKYASHG
jgi:hypothetical protein